MPVRRRPGRRPLAEFAARSSFHAFATWLLRAAVIGLLTLVVYVVVVNLAVPALIDGFTPS